MENEKGSIFNKVVKFKRFQKFVQNQVLIIPKIWIDDADWKDGTVFALIYNPYDKSITFKACDHVLPAKRVFGQRTIKLDEDTDNSE